MQPYFFPYAGYFRLFAAADLFVVYDCVQFPRRGRVHRCEMPGPSGKTSGDTQWLTLPLARRPRDVLIRDLAFAEGARAELDRRLACLTWIATARAASADQVRDHLSKELGGVITYLEDGLRLTCQLLGLERPMVRSSALEIEPGLRGQDRIIAISKAVGARRYVNPPRGRALYERDAFASHGLEVCFLPDYSTPYRSILPQLLERDPDAIEAEIICQTRLEPA
jgi:hypothetical protein